MERQSCSECVSGNYSQWTTLNLSVMALPSQTWDVCSSSRVNACWLIDRLRRQPWTLWQGMHQTPVDRRSINPTLTFWREKSPVQSQDLKLSLGLYQMSLIVSSAPLVLSSEALTLDPCKTWTDEKEPSLAFQLPGTCCILPRQIGIMRHCITLSYGIVIGLAPASGVAGDKEPFMAVLTFSASAALGMKCIRSRNNIESELTMFVRSLSIKMGTDSRWNNSILHLTINIQSILPNTSHFLERWALNTILD